MNDSPTPTRTPIIIGLDETGFGALAGPITVCAAHIKPEWLPELRISGARDSKRMSPERREQLVNWISENRAVTWAIHNVPAALIDRTSAWDAVCKAYRSALVRLTIQIDCNLKDLTLYVDGKSPIRGLPGPTQIPVRGGDDKILDISIASILAKVYRDHYMQNLSRQYPIYHWDQNKGYGHADHVEALYHYGPTPEHRFRAGASTAVLNHWEKHYKNRHDPLPAWVQAAMPKEARRHVDPGFTQPPATRGGH